MTVEELKARCEELIERGFGEAEVVYYKDFFGYHPRLSLCTPDQYCSDTIFGKDFPNTSKEFVLIDEE